MSSVKEIESALTRLPLQDLQTVKNWLEDFIEDQLEVSDEFKAQAIQEFIRHNNENPQPFIWTKRVDQILEKVGHCKAETVTPH